VGLLSTVKILVDNTEYKTHTTPDSITINHYLSEMVKEVEYCFMEVSSRNSPKKNGRTTVCWWRFTNLSHDHLDYHPTLQNTEM
jgi:UDP-N-acetylmuramoyl-L-alanyl-D-glutamate--2,6-diaminopimelate ligase